MKRILLGTAAALIVATGVIGFAHTPAGKPLLAYMPWGPSSSAGCPFGYDAPRTASARTEAQRRFAATHRGAVSAAARPALGFSLDVTTLAQVVAWAKAEGVACRQHADGHDLACDQVPAAALATSPEARDTLWLDFDAQEKLLSVIALRRDRDVERASLAFEKVTQSLRQHAGAPTVVVGDPAPASLRLHLLKQASAEFRFSDYYAVARTTHMPDGYLLIEEYRSNRESPTEI